MLAGPERSLEGAKRKDQPTSTRGGFGPGVCWVRSGSVLLGLFHAIARDVQLEDEAVVDQAVYGGGRGHWVLEYALPLGDRQIAGQ